MTNVTTHDLIQEATEWSVVRMSNTLRPDGIPGWTLGSGRLTEVSS